jgi:hypothetical protein
MTFINKFDYKKIELQIQVGFSGTNSGEMLQSPLLKEISSRNLILTSTCDILE